MISQLHDKKCASCEGGIEPMDPEEAREYLALTPEWSVKEGSAIERDFEFQDFQGALEFVNHVGGVAEEEGHHPDISLFDYKHVRITLSTHAIGGLSINDFILASKIDRIS